MSSEKRTRKGAAAKGSPEAPLSGPQTPSLPERFARLFQGYSRAYGRFTASKADEGGKIKGKAETVRGAPSLDTYTKHLNGTGPGLGIIMLRDDDTVLFGAIDYDNKSTNHAKAEERVRQLKLPLIVCRSKSGGAHFYCFAAEPVSAQVMRDRLAEWTAMLGMAANTEQFPKQAARFNENDIGSWINLPYFNSDATERYAVIGGQPASLSQFLDAAEAQRVPLSVLEQSAEDPEDALFHEGPPCLQHLSANGGFTEGTRNDGMFNTIVYLKRAHPDDWKSRVDSYNHALAGLGSGEVQEIIKSFTKKDYAYKCKQPPINAHCQRRKCLTRMYGVGETIPDSKGYEINALTRYDSANGDEPMWGMEINGKRVMVSNSQFYSRDEFNRQAMAQANVVPIHMPPQRWLKYLGELIATADIVPMPDDAGPTGQLWQHIENFATQKANALERDEVWLGKPFRENGSVYFRSVDLFEYLNRRRVRYPSEQSVWSLLRDRGAVKEFWNIRGKGTNVWSLPIPEHPKFDDALPAGMERHVEQDEEF